MRLIAIALILLIHYQIFAQNDTIKLADVYVRANFSKKLFADDIDSVYLKHNSTLRLADILKNFNTIYVKSFGDYGVSTVSFRGTSATHTQVYWNDTPLNSAMTGQTDFSIIPVIVADKISVSAGIKSLANSAGALGGIINLTTVPDYSKKFSLKIYSSANSMQNYSLGGDMIIHKNRLYSNTKVLVNLDKNHFEYLNTAIPPTQTMYLKNADTKQITFIQQFFYTPNKSSRLSAYFWLLNADRNIPPIMSFEGLHRTEKQIDTRIIAGLKFFKTHENIRLKNNFSVYNYGLDYFLGDSVISTPENKLIVKTNATSNELNFSNLFDISTKIDTICSADFSLRSNYAVVSTFDSAEYSQIGYKQARIVNQLNLIFFYNIKKFAFFTINLTEIITNLKAEKSAFFVSLSNEKLKKNEIFFDFNAGRNVHIPTLNDLYWQPGGNPDLKPEYGWSADFSTGCKYSKNNIFFYSKITSFASIINNWILWKPTEFHYWQAMNVKQVFSRGFNAKFTLEYKNKISYKIITNYAFTKSTTQKTYDELDISVGKQLIYTPIHTASGNFTIMWRKFELSTDLTYTSRQFTNTANYDLYTISSYTLLNLTVSKHLIYNKRHIINISLYINNVLNKYYQTVLFRPMPGRNFGINLKFKI